MRRTYSWKRRRLSVESDTEETMSKSTEPDLQRLLIEYYRTHLNFISISPIADDYVAPITVFYVQPPMVSIDIKYRILDRDPTKVPVTSYQQLLFSSNGIAKHNIYVTAEPGIGKTAFCKRLCAAWCQAHDPQEAQADKFSAEDISAMKRFEILFYISMREVGKSACGVDAMVRNFINHRLSTGLNPRQVESYCDTLLHKNSCLIVLDGLDEWNHPESCDYRQAPTDTPHRKHRNNNTIVTTTRPWKLDVIRLPESEIDSHVQIEELNEMQSKKLASKCIKFLNKKTKKRKRQKDLAQATSVLLFNEIRLIPYILIQCICLWFEGKSIGKSKCQVYSNILELTLERAMRKLAHPQTDRPEHHEMFLPSCLKELKCCLQYLNLLRKVSILAFSSLIKTKSRQMLIMDVEFTREYLTQEELELCLKLGLLNQEKSYGAVARQISNVSFNHKTFHEYFAAFYLYSASTSSERKEILQTVAKKCRASSAILEMSNIFVFLSGFDSRLYCELSQKMADTVMQDDRISIHRKSGVVWSFDENFQLALDYQKLQIDCAWEIELNGQEVPSLPLHDVIINKDTKCKEILSLLQKITHEKAGKVKSLCIDDCESIIEATHILRILDVNTLKGLLKLDLRCVAREKDVKKLLMQSQTTLQTLTLHSVYYKENRHLSSCTELSQHSVELMIGMPALQALHLNAIIIEHVQIQRVAAFITSRNTMTGLKLTSIRCKDHNDSCGGVTLDLSQHESMGTLFLHNIPISHLDLNVSSLEEWKIGKLPACVVRSWLSRLPAAQHLRRVVYRSFQDDTLPDLIDTIPALTKLEKLHIYHTDLSDHQLLFSPNMTRLDTIHLWKVNMQNSVLEEMANNLISHSLSVTVQLEDCSVTPEEDFQALKENIKSWKKPVVLTDELDSDNCQQYAFKTNP